MNSVFLSASHVTFRYFEQARKNILEDAQISFESGKITVIAGSSGCGKSTLAAICTGLYPENGGQLLSGNIIVCGQDINVLDNAERVKYISMMFQNPDLQFCMDTLRKEMIFCMENACIPKEKMDERIEETAGRLEVEYLLDQKLSTLSGGEKQKAVLSCLFLLDSKGFFLDEPFANLDEVSAKELVSLLCKQNKEKNTTIIAIDHRLDYWLSAADEIILMKEGGRIKERGITRETLPDYEELFDQEGIYYPAPPKKLETQPRKSGRPVLQLDHVSLKRGKGKETLLEDLSASFEEGSMTALLGTSGCGKTSLFSAILKQKTYEGKICWKGKDIKDISQRTLFRQIGTVFQNPSSQFISTQVSLEVEESISIWEPGIRETERKTMALEQLKRYGLKDYQKYSPYMLSQGQQRRQAVLSVLLGDQKLLLLDEPTYGQDAKSTAAIMDHLKSLMKERGLTVIFTTHDRRLALENADKVYYIENKRIKEWNG